MRLDGRVRVNAATGTRTIGLDGQHGELLGKGEQSRRVNTLTAVEVRTWPPTQRATAALGMDPIASVIAAYAWAHRRLEVPRLAVRCVRLDTPAATDPSAQAPHQVRHVRAEGAPHDVGNPTLSAEVRKRSAQVSHSTPPT
jgi:hypothetical protein